MNWKIIHLQEIESTNEYAKSISPNQLPAFIYADYQTKGKGQQNNTWYSEQGKNLLCSIVLPINLPVQYNNYISRWTSVLLVQLLLKFSVPKDKIKIKWPNDIIVKENDNYKKIAGILIENTIEHQYINQSIIGIGLNINQTNFPQFKKTATSLQLLTHQEYTIPSIVQSLISITEKYLPMMEYQKYDAINQEYIPYLYGWQSDFLFRLNNQIYKGKIIQLNDNGSISIQTPEFTRTFQNKEIEFLY